MKSQKLIFHYNSFYVLRLITFHFLLSLQDLRKKIQEINWQRKTEQTQAGEKLRDLETSWVGLVSKNYEIERACAEIEKEITEEEQKQARRGRKRPHENEGS